MTMPDFLITLGMGYELRPRLNIKYIKKLAQLNTDMSRFGNLLKMWITRDSRLFGSYSEKQSDQEILPKLMDKANEKGSFSSVQVNNMLVFNTQITTIHWTPFNQNSS